MGLYLSPVVTTFNLIVLLLIYFKLTGFASVFLVVGTLILLLFVGTITGRVHRIYQQDTDARMENKAVIEDIVDGVVKKLREKNEV